MGTQGQEEIEDSRFSNGGLEIILNEVLCFLSTKLDCVPTDVLVLLCSDAFDNDDVEKAKRILFAACPGPSDSRLRYIARQGSNKKITNLNDIIKKLQEAGTDAPVFVAKDLTKLPPIRMENIDVTNLLHRLEALTDEVSAMKTQIEKIQPLTEEISRLKVGMARLQTQPRISENSHRGVPAAVGARSQDVHPERPAPPRTRNGDRSHDEQERRQSQNVIIHTNAEESRATYASVISGNEWRTAGLKKKNYARRLGTGADSTITVVKNLKLVTMFGSRFGPNVTVEEVTNHFKSKGLNVTCEALKARHPERYASFKIALRAEDPFPLLKPENWPKGTYYRRYREEKSNTGGRRTEAGHRRTEMGNIDSHLSHNV